ncbi:hypothetical protein SAMN05444158_2168 [Bradyrhizobium canariense]|uniref:Uncharacterized protein n=1 Tax=Bradyrhizobium canariense TaxID=255045 RepID=A0A1H1SHP8_9BRAD|nr:hypothetical protein SAMN05444158_2168 [Bradyrhizobium canariense]
MRLSDNDMNQRAETCVTSAGVIVYVPWVELSDQPHVDFMKPPIVNYGVSSNGVAPAELSERKPKCPD